MGPRDRVAHAAKIAASWQVPEIRARRIAAIKAAQARNPNHQRPPILTKPKKFNFMLEEGARLDLVAMARRRKVSVSCLIRTYIEAGLAADEEHFNV